MALASDGLLSISVRFNDAKTLTRTLVSPACQREELCPARPCGADIAARCAPFGARVSQLDDIGSSPDILSTASRAIQRGRVGKSVCDSRCITCE